MEGVQLQGEVARQRAEIDKDVKVARLSEQDDIGYFNISTGRQSTEILRNIVVGVIPVERQESVVAIPCVVDTEEIGGNEVHS